MLLAAVVLGQISQKLISAYRSLYESVSTVKSVAKGYPVYDMCELDDTNGLSTFLKMTKLAITFRKVKF